MKCKKYCWTLLAWLGGAACSSGETGSNGEAASSEHTPGQHRADLDPSIGGHVVEDDQWGEKRPPLPVAGRDAWQKPRDLVSALGIGPGHVVADLGAGTGFFIPHLVEAVGPEGKVIAVEVSDVLVSRLQALAKSDGAGRVEVRLGEFADPHLAIAEVDWVIVVQTYAHIDERVDYFRRLKATLRPGGRLAVVDFVMGEIPEGPPPEERILPGLVQSEMEQAGWALVDSPELLEFHFVQLYSTGS